jgi:hypothetical protein
MPKDDFFHIQKDRYGSKQTNMKNFKFVLAVLMTALTIGFTACDSDNDKNDEPDYPVNPGGSNNNNTESNGILGTWLYTEAAFSQKITFTSSGRFTSVEEEYGYGTYTDYGSYTYSGSILTMKYDDEEEEILLFKCTISGDRMILEELEGDDVYVFKRIANGNSGNNDSETSKSQLVGKWEASSYGMELKADGTGMEWENGGYLETWPIRWTFSGGILTITDLDGPHDYRYIITYVSDSSLLLTDTDGDNFTYRKVSKFSWEDQNQGGGSDIDDTPYLVLGTWTGRDGGDTYTITFTGTGAATEVWSDGYDTEYKKGTYTCANGKITSWDFKSGSALANVLGDCPWLVSVKGSVMTIKNERYGYSMTFTKQ